MSMSDIDADNRAIRELVENWAVWRDARLWIVSARCGTPTAA